jgi:pimeloyl-ACP methyl ester carboxylesterase/DNA-binding SARP family transcriptional activator
MPGIHIFLEGTRVMKGKELLRVSVLGNLAVLPQRTRMQLPPSKKTRALLAYLAVTARPHSRDRLCAMFWAVPDDPRAALRWSLSRLRPLVDEPDCRRIIADRENVSFDLDRVTVDILALRSVARNGTDAISTDVLRQATEALEGDFLEGLDLPDCQEFQSWCTGEREETRRLRVRLLMALVARLEDVPDEALRHARTLSILEPANEAAQATLVRLLRAAGRWREAEEQFQSAQRRLEEFNVVCNGALRQAAQLPLQADARTRADDRTAPLTSAERLRAPPALHEVQFCKTSDGVRIAYASVGDGPPVVWAAHWLSHLAFSWESPVWRHWTEEFAKDYAFVHYDERGNGLSDWENPEFSVDAFVRDLEAVVDALGLDRFALLGSSKGGSTAMAYAALHPERVSHLVLYGTFAQGWRIQANGANVEFREAMITLIRQGWAQDNPAIRQILTSLLLPDATLEEMGWFNDLQRISASAENAARLLQSLGEINVLDLLPGIAAPTLVLHCRDDASVSYEEGRLIASRIPRARLVALESRNHLLLPRDPAWAAFVREVRRFLREEGTPMTSRASSMGGSALTTAHRVPARMTVVADDGVIGHPSGPGRVRPTWRRRT